MTRTTFILVWGVLVTAPLAACNNVGDCPSASAITPGGACSGDNLECPYTLETPSLACDGTTVEGGLATSCVCQSGSWACPSPVTCDASPAGEGGDDQTTGDASDGAVVHDASDGAVSLEASLDSSGE